MEQQQAGTLHPRILEPIRRLQEEEQQGDGGGENVVAVAWRHRLVVQSAMDVNHQSVQYLVDFLSSRAYNAHQEAVTELELSNFSLKQPSDGGLTVLIDCCWRVMMSNGTQVQS